MKHNGAAWNAKLRVTTMYAALSAVDRFCNAVSTVSFISD